MLYALRDWFVEKLGGKASSSHARDNFFAMNGFGKGGYDGARRDRLTEDWAPGNSGPNSIHQNGAAFLRERARDLVLNNDLAESAVTAYIDNVIGCGIWPKADFGDDGEEDGAIRDEFLREFERWGFREADCTRKQTFYELEALWLEEVIVGGGCLVHYLELPKSKNQRLGLSLELIPEERFCEDRDWSGTNKKTANRIERGIETDNLGRDVAYWVYESHPNDLDVWAGLEPIRLAADECEYAFRRRRSGQRRGYSWLNPIVQKLWKLGYYTDNELQSSAIKSCFSLIVKTADGSDVVGLADADGSSSCAVYDSSGNRVERVQPGMIGYMRNGDEVTAVMPTTPGSEAAVWTTLMQQGIAVGFGLSYEELLRDYSRGNFGTMRAGMNRDRIGFSRVQMFAVEHFCKPTYPRFVSAASRYGADAFPDPASYIANRDEWDRCTWQTPGWRSPAPLDDAKANTLNRQMGFDNHRDIVGNGGKDSDENFRQLQREKPKLDACGIVLDPKAVAALAAEEAAQNPPTPAKPKPKAKK